MANVNNPNGFFPWRGEGSAFHPTIGRLLKANTGIKKGDPVYIDGSGDLVVGIVAGSIYGFAAHDVTAPTDGSQEMLLLYPAVRDTLFHAQCHANYVAATYDGKLVDMQGSTGVFQINEDASAQDTFVMYGLSPIPRGNVAGTNARVLVRVARSQYEQVIAV